MCHKQKPELLDKAGHVSIHSRVHGASCDEQQKAQMCWTLIVNALPQPSVHHPSQQPRGFRFQDNVWTVFP